MESNGFFPDPGIQPVPDATHDSGPFTDDPLTSPTWTSSEVSAFAPATDTQESAAAVPLRASEPWPSDTSASTPAATDTSSVASLFAPPAAVAPSVPMAATLIDRSSPDVVHARPVTETTTRIAGLDLNALLATVVSLGASDLHLTAGARPMVRLHGSLQPVEDAPELSPPVIQTLLYAILTQRQRERFEAELELDFAYAVPGQSRFRVNMYRQRDAVGAAGIRLLGRFAQFDYINSDVCVERAIALANEIS